ncbi:hypothetical protein [Amycolatopsis sacchari]|uniref:hypothetical protein n=1 Tax=Amycolatopsis TaxID=1813 RepID=UPI003D7191DC
MNDNDDRMNPQHQHPHHVETPRPERKDPDPTEAAGSPEAVKEAAVSRKAAKDRLARVRGRGVDWVRPTDLFAQGGGALSRRGIDLTTRGNQRMRRPFEAGARWVADRAKRLPPVSAFGRRGPADQAQRRSGVGMR